MAIFPFANMINKFSEIFYNKNGNQSAYSSGPQIVHRFLIQSKNSASDVIIPQNKKSAEV